MLERLWSYLGLFRKMTKEMSSTHREDVLSDALFYLAKKLKSRIGRITTTVPHNKVINTFNYQVCISFSSDNQQDKNNYNVFTSM